MDQSFGIIGNGSWATALAKMLTDNNHRINWWMREEQAVVYLRERQHNFQYLTSIRFDPDKIAPSLDLEEVIKQSTYILIGVPSAYIMDILNKLPLDAFKGKVIISAIKGILPNCNCLLNDYLFQHFNHPHEQYISITGPCHAEEVAQERLSYLTFSGLDLAVTKKISLCFETKYIQTSVNHDLSGTQYAAVLKNIYAIGAGIAHGIGYGDNFLSVYITNCYREMYQFLETQYAHLHPNTEVQDFHTSAYLGDLLVTCYSPHSRNRSFGALLGKGYSIKAATTEMNMVAEGYFAVQGMQHIIETLKLEMPRLKIIHDILWNGEKAINGFKKMENILS